ncbi:MAG: MFS transporter [Epsilonproteobacteria bacterium]|nr:MFS transporter [Campylobacterota bacterium]
MIKTSLILFFIVTIIFSTIYTPQAILPELQDYFDTSIAQTNLLLFGMLFVLMLATPMYAPLVRRYEKKKLMLFSIGFLACSVLVSAWASNFYWLLFSRVLQGIFIPGITAIMLSYVQEIYPKKHRGLGMGIYMAATGFGAVLGRLLAGWMTQWYGWREAFGLFAVLLMVAWAVMYIGLPSSKSTSNGRAIDKKMILSYLKSFKTLSVLLVTMVVFFSFMAVSSFVTYRLAEAPFSLDASALGNTFLVLLVAVIVSPLAGKYSDTLGRVKVLFLGIVILLAGIVLSTIGSYILILLGLGLVTVGMFSVQAVAPTYLGDLVPDDKATAAVLYQTFFYFGGAMGTLLPAVAWNYGGYDDVALLCFGLVLLGSVPLGYNMILNKK